MLESIGYNSKLTTQPGDRKGRPYKLMPMEVVGATLAVARLGRKF